MSQTPRPAHPAQPDAPVASPATDSSPFATTPTLTPPSISSHEPNALADLVFGDFQLVEEIGRGGMGLVYKAKQLSLDRFVAIKLLLAEHLSNPPLLARFLAEARAAASLAHPNIVGVYSVGECDAGPYFVMEFIDGPPLELLLKRTLPVAWVVSLMATVADAVQHAHEKGIVHRDLKPANVMLHQQKRPVVMDFGIAKVIGKGSGLTQPGAIVGTPAYMPPEQAGEEASKIGPHSDVYSLGAILYTLLTGRVPFDEGTALKTILKVISPEPPPSIRSQRAEVPPKLEQITMKCLEKDYKRRYPTAHALADDLRRLKASLSSKPGTMSLRNVLPTVLLTSRSGKQVRLFQPATTLGRAQECDLVLKSSEVSKKHCRILIEPTGVYIEDLGSVNGTLVNGVQVERHELATGDQLDIAGLHFTVELQRPS